MVEADDVSCHDTSDKMIRQDVVSFLNLGGRELGTFNHCFVITKEKATTSTYIAN